MQEIINRDQPYAFLVHPKYPMAFNKAVFKEDTVVNQTGIGIRNIWTFIGIEPIGAQKDLIINSNERSTPPTRSISAARSTAGSPT